MCKPSSLEKKKGCFESLPGQKVKARSIILKLCAAQRQIEAMLLTFISKGGEDLEHFKRFLREKWREQVLRIAVRHSL